MTAENNKNVGISNTTNCDNGSNSKVPGRLKVNENMKKRKEKETTDGYKNINDARKTHSMRKMIESWNGKFTVFLLDCLPVIFAKV